MLPIPSIHFDLFSVMHFLLLRYLRYAIFLPEDLRKCISICLDCCTQGDHVMYDPIRRLLGVKGTLLLITPGKTTGVNQNFPGKIRTYVHLKLICFHSTDLRLNVNSSGKLKTISLARWSLLTLLMQYMYLLFHYPKLHIYIYTHKCPFQ